MEFFLFSFEKLRHAMRIQANMAYTTLQNDIKTIAYKENKQVWEWLSTLFIPKTKKIKGNQEIKGNFTLLTM